ncbi:MAG TPA: LTA synthase family protein [Gammaproteobacteria bacterium]|nr:LTA synthase family protein [Gammaproteobacteria bacterium]
MKIFKPLIVFCLFTLAALSLSRICLMLWKYDRVLDTDGLFFIFSQGLRFDLVLLGFVLLLPALITPLASSTRSVLTIWNPLLRIYLVVCFAGIIFVELSTPSFINQYDLRPNYLFVEYLKYPREVLSTLWAAYKLELILSLALTAGAAYLLNRRIKKYQSGARTLSWQRALLITPLLVMLCLGMSRSTLDHRAVNPSTVAFSADPLINTFALNSAYSVLYAVAATRLETSEQSPYGEMTAARAIELVKQSSGIPADRFTSSAASTLHVQKAYVRQKKPRNLVIVLEESLGADFVGALGGLKLTPNLDNLANQGIWFEHMYATGTRSVRGIEAVISGFTPTPTRSVVKLAKSQTGFFTIAELLLAAGYDTSFIYGGEAHFDNMRRFFANNGFNKIIDENDYDNPVFYGSWGASDEDLFNKAHDSFNAYAADQPFFSLVFTSSNHSPFDFPDGRIAIQDTQKATVENAVRYADYALGAFIEKARKSRYWENTLLVIVADHSDKVFGTEPVPIKRFHIPALILGADIEPTKYSPVASQIDLLPTLLSLMGIDSEHPAIGHDLARNIIEHDMTDQGRAIMQFGGAQAYMKGDRVVILDKGRAPEEYRYENQRLVPSVQQEGAFKAEALANSIWTTNAYNHYLYQLPGKDNLVAHQSSVIN